jgi:hypothetical protein
MQAYVDAADFWRMCIASPYGEVFLDAQRLERYSKYNIPFVHYTEGTGGTSELVPAFWAWASSKIEGAE